MAYYFYSVPYDGVQFVPIPQNAALTDIMASWLVILISAVISVNAKASWNWSKEKIMLFYLALF